MWHWRLCTQNTRLYLNNVISDTSDLFDNIVVLIRAYRILPQFCVDPFSQFSSICSRPSILLFHYPIGHTHITSESLCCYNGKRFNWFSFPNCLKCFSVSVYNVTVLKSILQKLFPLWANVDSQSSSETVRCMLQRRCNGIVSQHHFGCTFMWPWSETELKPVRSSGLELRCLLKENQ